MIEMGWCSQWQTYFPGLAQPPSSWLNHQPVIYRINFQLCHILDYWSYQLLLLLLLLLLIKIKIIIIIIIIYIYISLHLLTVPTRPHSPHEGHRAPRMGPSCDLYACGRTDTSNSNSYNHRDKSRKLIYKPYCKTMVIWVWINTY